jgi:hypothetical protein
MDEVSAQRSASLSFCDILQSLQANARILLQIRLQSRHSNFPVHHSIIVLLPDAI